MDCRWRNRFGFQLGEGVKGPSSDGSRRSGLTNFITVCMQRAQSSCHHRSLRVSSMHIKQSSVRRHIGREGGWQGEGEEGRWLGGQGDGPCCPHNDDWRGRQFVSPKCGALLHQLAAVLPLSSRIVFPLSLGPRNSLRTPFYQRRRMGSGGGEWISGNKTGSEKSFRRSCNGLEET